MSSAARTEAPPEGRPATENSEGQTNDAPAGPGGSLVASNPGAVHDNLRRCADCGAVVEAFESYDQVNQVWREDWHPRPMCFECHGRKLPEIPIRRPWPEALTG